MLFESISGVPGALALHVLSTLLGFLEGNTSTPMPNFIIHRIRAPFKMEWRSGIAVFIDEEEKKTHTESHLLILIYKPHSRVDGATDCHSLM